MHVIVFLTAFLFSITTSAQFDIQVTAPRQMEASQVKVIDNKKIQSYGEKNILDVLKTEAGVDVAREGLGGQGSVFIRGGESGHTLVLIDGMEVNDPSDPTRRFNFNLIDLAEVESIEIIKGARSVQYGSDAISGVINIVTKKNMSVGGKIIKARQEVGSFHTSKTTAQVSLRPVQALQYNLKGQYFQTKGYSVAKVAGGDDDSLKRLRVNNDLTFNLANHEVIALGELQKIAQELDAGAGADDPNARMDSINGRFAALYHGVLADDKIEPRLGYSYNKYNREYADPVDPLNTFGSESTTRGSAKKIDYSLDYHATEKLKLVAGGEVQREAMSIDSPDVTLRMGEATNKSHGEFLLGELKLDQWEFYLGGRLDRGNYFDSQENGRGSINYKPFSFLELSSSIGTGFKAPTLYQVYAPTYGNPEVRPETSRTWDIGFKTQATSMMKLESTYFVTEYEDLILFNNAKLTRNYENTKEARIRGIENSLGFNLHQWLELDFSYTYMDSKDKMTLTTLPARSRHKAGLTVISAWTQDFRTTATVSMIGKRRNSSSNLDTNPGYAVVTTSTDYNFTKSLNVGARIENLLDKSYVEFNGFNTAKRSYFGFFAYSFE